MSSQVTSKRFMIRSVVDGAWTSNTLLTEGNVGAYLMQSAGLSHTIEVVEVLEFDPGVEIDVPSEEAAPPESPSEESNTAEVASNEP